MPHEFSTSYLTDAARVFRAQKRLADGAIGQVTDAQLTEALDPESNSIALIVKHIAGNIRSRWTNFLTTDGEKPDRDRDTEFADAPATRAALLELWESAWAILFDALEPLTENDLTRTVFIRGEPHSVVQAINRQVAHYSHHIGQIVFLAKHLQHESWKSLSIPRNTSAEFNRRMAEAAGQK
jgi:uncharacterized damage-inducible protein DinB